MMDKVSCSVVIITYGEVKAAITREESGKTVSSSG